VHRAWWIAGLGLVLACAGVQNPKDDDLRVVVDRFLHDVRWQYTDTAAARVLPACSDEFQDALDDAKDDLKVTGWEIRRAEPIPGDGVKIRLQISYYLLPSTVLKEETVEQIWKQEDKKWFLQSQAGGPFEFPPKGCPPAAAPEPANAQP